MTWAQYPGIALDGSNRALLYLLIFTLLTALPWTKESVLGALLLFAGGVGVVGMVLMVRLASGANVTVLFVGGRLAAPTGYINATAALFMMGALPSIMLASRRSCPARCAGCCSRSRRPNCSSPPCRAAAGCSRCPWSRSWRSRSSPIGSASPRLRCCPRSTAIVARRLLHVYGWATDPLPASPTTLPPRAGCARCSSRHARGVGRQHVPRTGCTGPGGAIAASARRRRGRRRGRRRSDRQPRRPRSLHLAAVARVRPPGDRRPARTSPMSAAAATTSGGSRSTRSSAHPIGGIGQDNFADYYIPRHTGEEPAWPHSLELRVLAHTGIVGAVLFAVFIGAFVGATGPARPGSACAVRSARRRCCLRLSG